MDPALHVAFRTLLEAMTDAELQAAQGMVHDHILLRHRVAPVDRPRLPSVGILQHNMRKALEGPVTARLKAAEDPTYVQLYTDDGDLKSDDLIRYELLEKRKELGIND